MKLGIIDWIVIIGVLTTYPLYILLTKGKISVKQAVKHCNVVWAAIMVLLYIYNALFIAKHNISAPLDQLLVLVAGLFLVGYGLIFFYGWICRRVFEKKQ